MTDITFGAAPAAAGKRKSVFARLFDALIDARMQHARREISLHLHLLPDEVARQLRSELGRAAARRVGQKRVYARLRRAMGA
jgi:hypothetical protein